MIRERENALRSAVIIEGNQQEMVEVGIGSRVILHDLGSGEELHYMIVSPNEAEPAKGKLSSSSPVGKAIIGRSQGEIVEVVAPTGKTRYQIEAVIRPET